MDVNLFRAVSEKEATAWEKRRSAELSQDYHFKEKIAAGNVLVPLGFGLAIFRLQCPDLEVSAGHWPLETRR